MLLCDSQSIPSPNRWVVWIGGEPQFNAYGKTAQEARDNWFTKMGFSPVTGGTVCRGRVSGIGMTQPDGAGRRVRFTYRVERPQARRAAA